MILICMDDLITSIWSSWRVGIRRPPLRRKAKVQDNGKESCEREVREL